jgi:hypothetical protein
VIHKKEVCRLSINATHFVVTVLVLGTLNNEAEVKADALTNDGSILPCVMATFLRVPHLAAPPCRASVSILRILYFQTPIHMFVHLRYTAEVGMV